MRPAAATPARTSHRPLSRRLVPPHAAGGRQAILAQQSGNRGHLRGVSRDVPALRERPWLCLLTAPRAARRLNPPAHRAGATRPSTTQRVRWLIRCCAGCRPYVRRARGKADGDAPGIARAARPPRTSKHHAACAILFVSPAPNAASGHVSESSACRQQMRWRPRRRRGASRPHLTVATTIILRRGHDERASARAAIAQYDDGHDALG